MKKKNIILTSLLFIIFGVYTFIIKTVGVKAIGPKNSKVGLASINGWVRDVIGNNMTIYIIVAIIAPKYGIILKEFVNVVIIQKQIK